MRLLLGNKNYLSCQVLKIVYIWYIRYLREIEYRWASLHIANINIMVLSIIYIYFFCFYISLILRVQKKCISETRTLISQGHWYPNKFYRCYPKEMEKDSRNPSRFWDFRWRYWSCWFGNSLTSSTVVNNRCTIYSSHYTGRTCFDCKSLPSFHYKWLFLSPSLVILKIDQVKHCIFIKKIKCNVV